MGVAVSETSSEIKTATLSITANSRNSRPTMPPIIRMGMNTAISDMLMESTVNPISGEPFNAACSGGIPASRYRVMFSITTMASSTTKPVDNRQRHQRQVVERIAEQVHHAESSDQGHRNGYRRNHRGPHVAQENENHQNHQQDRDQQRDLNFVHGRANRGRAVAADLKMIAAADGSLAAAEAQR